MLRDIIQHGRSILRTYQTGGRSPSGVPLPPGQFRMGGHNFETDEAFVASAVREVDLLGRHGLTATSRVIDWGCGAGRLAVGIRETLGDVGDYHGVDVQEPLIRWARRHLGGDGFRFTHVDVANPRYNPGGSARHRIPGEDGGCDVFYANSVFSHMLDDQARAYLAEFARLLAPDGVGVFTAFVEDEVDPVVENPPDYGPLAWSGRAHCVRYDRGFFDAMVDESGLRLVDFEHGTRSDGQSLYVVG